MHGTITAFLIEIRGTVLRISNFVTEYIRNMVMKFNKRMARNRGYIMFCLRTQILKPLYVTLL